AMSLDSLVGLLLTQECLLGGGEFGTIIATREQVTVGVGSHLDRGVAETGLHDFDRQFEPAIDAAVDAPACIEMAHGVQAGVFSFAIGIDNAGLHHQWDNAPFDDPCLIPNLSRLLWENQIP